jgi:hypothetical protein
LIINYNFSPFTDSESDAEWDFLLGPAALQIARDTNTPIRERETCTECKKGKVQYFIGRDLRKPQYVIHGVICENPKCSVMYVGVVTDLDGVER